MACKYCNEDESGHHPECPLMQDRGDRIFAIADWQARNSAPPTPPEGEHLAA